MKSGFGKFERVFEGKRVLVTGHTGFKGSWLSYWLIQLGAEVIGFSKYLPSEPNNFSVLNLGGLMQDVVGDVTDLNQLEAAFREYDPQIVFHLAAQPIVRDSYEDPKLTFDTNLGGTVNVLECLRKRDIEAAVLITSDKCYENVHIQEGYVEDDLLGGADPYSASKACAEIAFSAYYRSFFSDGNSTPMATTRAGNVIGGGDWARDRIVPDCVRAVSSEQEIVLRKPEATRPWQHVLEPLGGYLWLASSLVRGRTGLSGEPFNFGPRDEVVQSVEELVNLLLEKWGTGQWRYEPNEGDKKEATLLRLSCEKAKDRLGWEPVLTFDQTIAMTAAWYKAFYDQDTDMQAFTGAQIEEYVARAKESNAVWV